MSIYIRFGPSRSKRLARAVEVARTLPGYSVRAGTHEVEIGPDDFNTAGELFSIVSKWKSARFLINGAECDAKDVRAVLSPKGDWYKLEKRVNTLELLLDPTLKAAPHFITDGTTGGQRQVDGHFTRKMGGSEVRMVIECRDHKSKQDVCWVEQSITRRDDLRADVYVLVSSSGFTVGAIEKAKQRNIRLREYRSILQPEAQREWDLVPARLTIARDSVESAEIIGQGGEVYRISDLGAPLFTSLGDEGTAAWMWLNAMRQGFHDLMKRFPHDGNDHPLTITGNFPETFRFNDNLGFTPAYSRLKGRISYRVVPPSLVEVTEYRALTPKRELMKSGKYCFDVDGVRSSAEFRIIDGKVGPITLENPVPGSAITFTTPPGEQM